MNQGKYIGMDVRQATISVAVMNSSGKLVMECILETKAATILVPADLCGGGQHCPPEDCGGSPGFSELLKVLQESTHPEHEDIREWVGEDSAPEDFSVNEINRKLRRRKL